MKNFENFGEKHTGEQWKEMIKAIESGEEVKISEWIYYYFLEVLPPIYSFQSGFLLQEAVRMDDDGDELRLWFYGTPKTGFWSQLVKTRLHVKRQDLIAGGFI